MAKLGGKSGTLNDIRIPFAVREGGRVTNLTGSLDFFIRTRGTSSASDIVDEVSGRFLTSSVAPIFNRGAIGFPRGINSFSSDSGFTIPLVSSNAYPSYLKDEQTVFLLVRNVLTGAAGEIVDANPALSSINGMNMKIADPGTSNFQKYLEEIRYGAGGPPPVAFGTASGSLYRAPLIFTSASYTTGSKDVSLIPFLVHPFIPMGDVRPIVFTYRDWVYDSNLSTDPKLRAADVVATTYDVRYRQPGRTPKASRVDVGGSGVVASISNELVGRNTKRDNLLFAVDVGQPVGFSMMNNREWSTLCFRQRLGNYGDSDNGIMDVWFDGKKVFWQAPDAYTKEGTSRFTVEDRSEAGQKENTTQLSSTLRSVSRAPAVMGLGVHDYGFLAGWSRLLTDEEIRDLHQAAIEGCFVEEQTSTSSPALAAGQFMPKFEHVSSLVSSGIETSFLTSRNFETAPVESFKDSSSVDIVSGSTLIKIDVKTIENPNSLGYAYRNHGVCDVGQTFDGSRQSNSSAVHGAPFMERIIFLNSQGFVSGSSITNQVQDFIDANGAPGRLSVGPPGITTITPRVSHGNAGTGFLYYSPKRQSWIEKRPSHRPSYRTKIEIDCFDTFGSPIGSEIANDYSGSESVSALEFNADTPESVVDTTKWSFHLTGANGVLCQFAGSPHIGYLHPWKESLEAYNYGRMGYPTSLWGAPTDSKYHAFDDETIKMSDYIDRPFLLESIEFDVDIEAARLFVDYIPTSSYSQTRFFGHTEKWARFIMNRRDIENYSFFLYRQRRKGGSVVDSPQDISSSERFLIASASLAFYNSASFGGAYKDEFWTSSSNFISSYGFTDAFAVLSGAVFNPTSSFEVVARHPSSPSSVFDNSIYAGQTASLSRWTEPLHGPAFSHNWDVDFTFSGFKTYAGSINLKMKPAVAPYGFTSPTLMTFVGGKSMNYSTGGQFALPIVPIGYRPMWFHTGTFMNPFTRRNNASSSSLNEMAGSGTFAYQLVNFWHGSTRNYPIFHSGTVAVDQQKKIAKASRNMVLWAGDQFDIVKPPGGAPYQVPINGGEYGTSIFHVSPSFSQYSAFDNPSNERITVPELQMLIDGRARSCPTINPGDNEPVTNPIENLDSNIYNINNYITWRNVGYKNGIVALSPKRQDEIQETQYLLLPGDELVLGLENSNLGTPDFCVRGVPWGGPLGVNGFVTGAYKDRVLDFMPFSYLRVVPGIGEIRLIGKYLRNDEAYTIQKTSRGDITTVIGDVPYDQFQVTETDGYYGGIFDEIITGSTNLTSQPYRGVAGHATEGDIKGNFSLNRFFTVYTDKYIRDYYDDPVRNTLRSTGSLPGSTTYGYRIPQKAVLSSIHYGYLRDFLETPPYQVLASTERKATFNVPPVTVRFVEKSSTQLENLDEFQKSQTSPLSILGQNTTSQNVNKFARLDGPFKDGQFTDRDELEYTVTV